MGKHRNRRNNKQIQQSSSSPSSNGGNARVLVAHASTAFSGPLPPPDLLAKYDQIMPGCAARIVDMATKQSDHRMDLERKLIGHETNRANWGLASATIVSIAILGCGTACILKGHDTAGATIVGIDMVGVITAFLVGTVQRRKEREQKAQIQSALMRQ